VQIVGLHLTWGGFAKKDEGSMKKNNGKNQSTGNQKNEKIKNGDRKRGPAGEQPNTPNVATQRVKTPELELSKKNNKE